MKKHKLLRVFNLLFYIATVTVNYLAVLLPLNNKTTGELSELYPNLFVPAGITFSIWGIIYLLLGIFAVYQFIGIFRETAAPETVSKIGGFFILSCIFNMAWIFAWHYEMVGVSVLIMLVLLATLITIYLRLKVGKVKRKITEKLFSTLPFRIYLGWITLATVANITAYLVSIGWNGFGLSPVVWTVIMICACVVITLLVLVTRRDIAFALVIIWGLLGIILKRLSIEPVETVIIITSWISIGVIAVTGLLALLVRPKKTA